MAEDRDGFDRDSNRFLEDSQRDQQRKPSNTTNTGQKRPKKYQSDHLKITEEKFHQRNSAEERIIRKILFEPPSGKILNDFDPKNLTTFELLHYKTSFILDG